MQSINGDRDREQTYGHGYGVRKERVGCMERITWKHTLPYVKQIVKRHLLYDSGDSNQVSVTT